MFKHIKKIFLNYRLNKKLFRRIVTVALISNIGNLLSPIAVKYLMDMIFMKEFELRTFLYIITLGLIASGIGTFFSNRFWNEKARFDARITEEKKIIYMKDFLDQDYEHIHTIGTGKIITKLNEGVFAEMHIFGQFLKIINDVVIKFIWIIIAFALFFPTGLIYIFFLIILLRIIQSYVHKKIEIYTDKIAEINEAVGNSMTKSVMEYFVISVFNKKGYEIEKLRETHKNYVEYNRKVDFYESNYRGAIWYGLYVLEMLVYLYFGYLVYLGEISPGYIALMTTYLYQLRAPVNILSQSFMDIKKNLIKYNNLQKFLYKPKKIIDGMHSYIYQKGQIDIKNISFDYNKKSLFYDFSLHIPAGKVTALVGHSGSGKSSLMKLLMRMYDPKQGEILYDGQNLKDLKISTLYDHIGFLSQDPAIFDGTIRENLLYATQSVTIPDDELWQALSHAELSELVRSMPEKLDTQIGEKGIKLSGGEKQRLAIARLFLKDPNIIILDEPTSALDSISEHKVTKAINTILQNRTVVVIAHRLQTVMHADQIVLMEKGKMLAIGTHKELLKQSEIYASMVDLQSGLIKDE